MKQLKRLLFCLFSFLITASVLFSQDAEKAAEHAQRKVPTVWDFLVNPLFITKFILMLVLGLIAFALLKTKKMKTGIKIGLLLLATFLFGILGNFTRYFAMHPSPMCAATKSLLYGFGIPLIITLVVIFLLTLIGPKLFCGYVCPVGAIQELISMLSRKLKIKRNSFSFTASQAVRFGIFLLFIFLSGTAVLYGVYEGKKYALSLYDYINPFHGMEIGSEDSILDYIIHYVPFLLTVLLAFKYYRPFCHFVCPVGLYTHWLEQIGLHRITFKKNSCSNCNLCAGDAPCTAIPEILKEATLRPDCFACNECISNCPDSAFEVGIKRTVND